MMKLWILVFMLLSVLKINAQEPDPDLFQTWHMRVLGFEGSGEPYKIEYNVHPRIYPYMTIMEDLRFEGQAACNSYSGEFVLTSNGYLGIKNVVFTNTDCGFLVHNNFEGHFYDFLTVFIEYNYNIQADADGQSLTIDEPLQSFVSFKNYPLSVDQYLLDRIKVHPNPANSSVNLEIPELLTLENVDVLTLQGQRISVELVGNTFDVSSIAAGIYFLQISTSEGIQTIKLIKN